MNIDSLGTANISRKERISWVDGLRTWLAFCVFFIHMCSEYSLKWGILDQILYGFTGKYAVAFFAIMLGFFAHKPDNNASDLSSKIIRRYIQFSMPLFLVTSFTFVIYYLLNIEKTGVYDAIIQIIKERGVIGRSGQRRSVTKRCKVIFGLYI